MSRPTSPLAWVRLPAIAFLAAGSLLRADDQTAPKPPPGYKVIYQQIGGQKRPIFVKDQLDPLRHADMGTDPLDHQKVYSETNAMANKTFLSGPGSGWNKTAETKQDDSFSTKVYNTAGPRSVYNFGSKSTFRASSYNGTSAATGFDKSFAPKSADAGQDQTATAFAAIGASEQNRTAPINPKPVDTFAAPMANKTFMKATADNTHHGAGELGDGTLLSQLPNRPLSIDEVKNLINHGFKPNLDQPAAPESKPLNDPDYQPTPLRIDPSTSDGNPPAKDTKVDDDDKDDPVPPPGTMAEPLPSK